jgi:hypothetical protein
MKCPQPPGVASRGEDRRQAAPQRRRAPAPCAGLDEVGKALLGSCPPPALLALCQLQAGHLDTLPQ